MCHFSSLCVAGAVAVAVVLEGCGGGEALRTLTLDSHADLCIDKEQDGACNDQWVVFGGANPDFYSDYLNQERYAALVVVTMADGSRLQWAGPGVTIAGTLDTGSAVEYQLAVSSDPNELGVLSQKAHYQTDGTWQIGGLTGVTEAWLVIDHEYDPAELDPATIVRAEVHYAVLYQVAVPMNDAHNDDQRYVYAGSASWDASELDPASGLLSLNTNPLMLEKATGDNGTPLTDLSQISFSVPK